MEGFVEFWKKFVLILTQILALFGYDLPSKG